MTSVSAILSPASITSNNGQSSAPICMVPRVAAKLSVTSIGAAEPGLACCAVQFPSSRPGALAIIAGSGGMAAAGGGAGGGGCTGGGGGGAGAAGGSAGCNDAVCV